MPSEAVIALLILVPTAVIVITVGAWRLEPNGRTAFVKEAALVLAAFALYFAVRSRTEGNVTTALANAASIVEWQRQLGIYVEPMLQEAILAYSWIVAALNWIYTWGHWPVIGGVAIWLYRSHHADYRLFRNAFLISGGIGLICFALFPVAPPRLTDLGMTDTVLAYSVSYQVLQPAALVNQYAAMPSLHFGWNVLIAIAVARQIERPALRALTALMPMAMLSSIVLTANHFILDAAGGAAVALTGLLIAARIPSRETVVAALPSLPLLARGQSRREQFD